MDAGRTSQTETQASPTNPIKGMMDAVKNASNPGAMMEQMAAQNPQLRNVMELVQQSGGDAKGAFYALAKQKGVDPESILSLLR